eukprot:scaffold578_cov167-Amphora_coffeaeformis.AAC.46
MFRRRFNGGSATTSGSSAATASQPPDPRFAVFRDEDLPYQPPDQQQLAQQPPPAVVPYGVAPSGTLKIRQTSQVCPGFQPPPSCIRLEYDIPAGTQLPHHPHPGRPYPSTYRHAFLPNNNDGCKLLARMKVAWNYGHMFKIGRSLTTGLDDQVCWTTVMNKTSLQGGPFGFPDSSFIGKANAELDQIGIPSADHCQHLLAAPMTGGGAAAASPMAAAATAPVPLPPPINPSFAPTSNATTTLPAFGVPTVGGVPVPSGFATTTAAASPTFPIPVPAAVLASVSAPPAPTNGMSTQRYNTNTDTVHYEQIFYAAPPSLASTITPELFEPITTAGDDDCAICLEKVSKEKSVQIKACEHEFHLTCLQDAMQQNPKCPTCRKPLDCARGKSPSGTMTIEPSNDDCPGFGPGVKAIRITYVIPSGVQKEYHENPNVPYDGDKRVAFLPNTPEGRKLLKRFKYAWTHGLMFRVGTSLTTHLPNQVTWTSIHHKTSLRGGVHGFPDASYMDNVNASLDAHHVPSEP